MVKARKSLLMLGLCMEISGRLDIKILLISQLERIAGRLGWKDGKCYNPFPMEGLGATFGILNLLV